MKLSIGSLTLLFGICLAGGAVAQVTLSTPDLPPEPNPIDCEQIVSQYEGDGEFFALFPGGIDITQPRHFCFQNVFITPLPVGEVEDFDSTFEGLLDDGSGPQLVTLTGPVQVIAYGKSTTEGSWQTEILSMDLEGPVGGSFISIRLDPTLPSQGQTSVMAIDGGLYEIDSFFDVFIELSIDGGPFQRSLGPPGRLTLVAIGPPNPPGVPSLGPSGLVVLLTALAVSGAAVWCRKATTKS